jgi:hypothetical protein
MEAVRTVWLSSEISVICLHFGRESGDPIIVPVDLNTRH